MKYILSLLSIFILVQISVFGQDIIITRNNDTIQCKIIGIEGEKLVFKTVKPNGYMQNAHNLMIVKDTIKNFHIQLIKDKDILESIHSHYIVTLGFDTIYCNIIDRGQYNLIYSEVIGGERISKGIPNDELLKIQNLKKPINNSVDRFEINLHGGFSSRLVTRTKSADPLEEKLFDELNNGMYIRGDASYYFYHRFGLGVLYSHFGTSGSGNISVKTSETDSISLPAELDIAINYLALRGAIIFFKEESNFRFGVNLNVGRIFYREEGHVDGLYTNSKGSNFGFGFGFDIAYYFTQNFGLTVNGNLLAGKLKEIDVNIEGDKQHYKLENEDRISLNQFQFGGGIIIKI